MAIVTNSTQPTLGDYLQNGFPICRALDFLVGYFYFSGFSAIATDEIREIPMRVLVGLDAEIGMANVVGEFNPINKEREELSIAEIKNRYFSKLVEVFNNTDLYDDKENADKFNMFVNKLQDGSLQIRKTQEPNHAKMYVLSYMDNSPVAGLGVTPGIVVIGSSNLSANGLRNQFEINSVITEKSEHEEALRIFNSLWENSIELVSSNNYPEFKKKVLDNIWYGNTCSPFLMYLKVLDEYFSLEISRKIKTPNEINKDYSNFRYQIDAVKMALDTIEKHNGVIIADVVGLGKSIVASVVARNLNLDTIIISPPHLSEQWNGYKTQFKVNATVFSSGKIQNALKFYNDHLSGTQCFIIVDEAHRYRNPETQDYKVLHELCMGNKVALLTATPFNNTPSDIYAMVSLFQIPSRSTLQAVSNLGAVFKDLMAKYKKMQSDMQRGLLTDAELKVKIGEISKQIRTIIEPLVVRRSRIDLQKISVYRKDLETQGINFPQVADPEAQTYELGDIERKYVRTLDLISPTEKEPDSKYYKAARYSSLAYVKEDRLEELKRELNVTDDDFGLFIGRQKNLSDFMKRLLVRRFESSVFAFYKTLDSMIEKSKEMLTWIETQNKIPVFKKGDLPDPRDLFEVTSDEAIAEAKEKYERLERLGFYTIDMRYIKPEFVNDIKSDIKLLEGIKRDWFQNGTDYNSLKETDPKARGFIDLIKEKLEEDPSRKIIVFSEFSDTVNYIYRLMKDANIRVLKYTSDDASNSNRDTIRLNFDAGVKVEKQKNDYDVLVATDAISEGYSLHRAGTIFNYDIPYNPTRVIQRVGRINRINKKMFDTLYIFNYFPSFVGEPEINIKAISTLKMAMIQEIMGEDTRILAENESLNSYFVERYRKENALIEAESGETKHREIWETYLNSELMEKARKIPRRTRIRRESSENQGIIIFGKRGTDYVFKYRDSDGKIFLESPFDALNMFAAQEDEIGSSTSNIFDEEYKELKGKLFSNDAEDTVGDRTKAIDKINSFVRMNGNDTYFDDLKKVIEEYDALPKYELRLISNADANAMREMKEKISQDYIDRIFKSVEMNSHKPESIVLIEEFRGGNGNV